ncbi:hypothetical protein [Streptomyces parvulus]|uniref:Golvesin/Xly CBD-like domain-containing protein n=1 Tax=Streptomyces parvulus TaxID=146923 RepID=A0A369UXC9_9ACTN|nr:hypothetical protein [Streptomyces parvulus]RDD85151.1 hypothetical protein DVZ84_31740 [Streptomyces parvulus]
MTLLQAPAQADPAAAESSAGALSAAGASGDWGDSVPARHRAALLGDRYRESHDVAWASTGDAQGFHILTATARSGYTWQTTASLAEPGFDADQWIGNVCVTASGRRAVVVYAPRTFTNDPKLMARGGFSAVVDLASGAVTKLKVNASLSYYNPGCGTGEQAVLTQSAGEDKRQTRLLRVDAASGTVAEPVVVEGQITSSVPGADGGIVAAAGRTLVDIDRQGTKKRLVTAATVPYRISADADSGYVYLERVQRDSLRQARTAVVRRWSQGRTTKLASGPLNDLGMTRVGGQVYLTGTVNGGEKLPRTVTRLKNVTKNARLSTEGSTVVQQTVWADGATSTASLQPASALAARPVILTVRVGGARDAEAEFTVIPLTRTSPRWETSRAPSPLLGGTASAGKETSAAGKPTAGLQKAAAVGRMEIVGSERTCSVPRGDPRNQAMQPKPRQVEWAVDKAVAGNLNTGASRPANWKNLGMPAYGPQTLFPQPALAGGGRVPAQVLLGITTQESNMWQAARSAVPGVTGNPLIGNYYGINYYDGDTGNDWDVNWAEADCGYGVTQVTDHMRMAGREHGSGGAAWDYQKQRAVALDYAANIAAGLQILVSKWNQTHEAGMVVNNGNPARVENWFYALWAYNSGFYPRNDSEPWGVGWTNNPANPEWDASRNPFMEDALGNEHASDAATPQNWPYPEKVLGFAAHPPAFLESPGTMVPAFRAAWWNGIDGNALVPLSAKWNRAHVKPPEDLFCGSNNWCEPSLISDGASNNPGAGPCTRSDYKCWFHDPVQWKDDCNYSCGNEFFRFPSPDYDAEQADGTAYPPACTPSGLPANAMIIDDLPAGTPSVRPGCPNTGWNNEGSFSLDFGQGEAGVGHDGSPSTVWPAKVDLHQLGAGFGGHFYFGHTRRDDTHGRRMNITATWKLNQPVDGPAKVMVHLPDHGAHTALARYEVVTKLGTRSKVINQQGTGNRWVSLGGFMFDQAPEIRLTTLTRDGTGLQDIAFDAVAVVPIDGTYREEAMEAVAFFDEDQNIDVRMESAFFNTPLKSRQALYDWARDVSGDILAQSTCGDTPGPACVKPHTRQAMQRWHDEVTLSGTGTEDHPDGHSIPAWLRFSNNISHRPTTDRRPQEFGTDDSSYKLATGARVSFIESDGTIVEGSETVQYHDRTADTHLPDFVRDTFTALEEDYGIRPPDLTFTAANLNEHNGQTTAVDANTTGILPGAAYTSLGVAPTITDYQDRPVTDGTGTCVSVLYTAGGSIGYRTALAQQSVTDDVTRWVDQAEAAVGSRLGEPIARLTGEIRNMFFKPGLTGSIFGAAPPIWQELNFKTCVDGTVRRIGDTTGSPQPLLRASYMPSQYLYRNGRAADLTGQLSGSSEPVSEGNFEKFSGPTSTPELNDSPYGPCGTTGDPHGGNPWGIGYLINNPGIDPPTGKFCSSPNRQPHPAYSR